MRKLLGWMGVFITLIVVMVSQVCLCQHVMLCYDQIVSFKYMQFISYQLYLMKAVKKNNYTTSTKNE